MHYTPDQKLHLSYKDVKAFTADLKPVYKAATEQAALDALDECEKKWSKKYLLDQRD